MKKILLLSFLIPAFLQGEDRDHSIQISDAENINFLTLQPELYISAINSKKVSEQRCPDDLDSTAVSYGSTCTSGTEKCVPNPCNPS